jgi:hypothetical protein
MEWEMWSAEWGVGNETIAECGLQNADCRMQNR